MKTEAHIGYCVASDNGSGSHYQSHNYSKYHERMNDKSIPADQVYGFEQAIDHVRELREHVYNGACIHVNDVFVIKTITTVTTSIESLPTGPEGYWVLCHLRYTMGQQERTYKNEFGENITDRKYALRFSTESQARKWRKANDITESFTIIPI